MTKNYQQAARKNSMTNPYLLTIRRTIDSSHIDSFIGTSTHTFFFSKKPTETMLLKSLKMLNTQTTDLTLTATQLLNDGIAEVAEKRSLDTLTIELSKIRFLDDTERYNTESININFSFFAIDIETGEPGEKKYKLDYIKVPSFWEMLTDEEKDDWTKDYLLENINLSWKETTEK